MNHNSILPIVNVNLRSTKMIVTLAGAAKVAGILATALKAIYLFFVLQHHHTHVANNIDSAIKVTCLDSQNRPLSQVVSPGEVVSMETAHDRLSYAVEIKTGNSFGENVETAFFVADSDISFIVEYKEGALNIMTSKYGKVWERDEVLRTMNMQFIEQILNDASNKLYYVTVAALGFSDIELLQKLASSAEGLGKMLEVIAKIMAAAG